MFTCWFRFILLGGSQLERNVCKHVIVSLLKAWNVTVAWIVYDDAFFLTLLQESTHHKVLAQDKNLNSASKVANWIIVDIPKYVY